MENSFDDTIPMQYLANENPYAYCEEYHKNSINLPEKKVRLNALQRMQPQKLSFRMPQKHLERERNNLIEAAITNRKSILVKQGLNRLGIDFHENVEELFANNLNVPEIFEIAHELMRYKLVHQQKKLRRKVATALAHKLTESVDYTKICRPVLEVDNLKEALIFCQLEELYGKRENV